MEALGGKILRQMVGYISKWSVSKVKTVISRQIINVESLVNHNIKWDV